MKQILNQAELEIINMFDEIYESINAKYKIEKPYLKIVKIRSMTLGSYNPKGFAYSHNRPTIKININHDLTAIKKTMIHEFCHLVNSTYFGYNKKPSHNKNFWKLTQEFGLTERDYFKTTKSMKGVF